MSRKCIVNMVLSIDGFIADKNGNRDFSVKAHKQDKEFDSFYKSIDTIVMGRKTYDQVKSVYPQILKEKKVFVITHYLRQEEEGVCFIHENIIDTLSSMKNKAGKDIWVMGGSELVNLLMKENLIDTFILTTAPLLIGDGKRLFHEGNRPTDLGLEDVTRFDDYVKATYIR